jgi:hypothetical protein
MAEMFERDSAELAEDVEPSEAAAEAPAAEEAAAAEAPAAEADAEDAKEA